MQGQQQQRSGLARSSGESVVSAAATGGGGGGGSVASASLVEAGRARVLQKEVAILRGRLQVCVRVRVWLGGLWVVDRFILYHTQDYMMGGVTSHITPPTKPTTPPPPKKTGHARRTGGGPGDARRL